MTDEDTHAVCPNCGSVVWSTGNIYNTTDGKGVIQALCNDCGNQFEMEVKSSTGGWTIFESEDLAIDPKL